MRSDTYTYQEILSQAAAWDATLSKSEHQISPMLDWLRQPRNKILLIGCGSTYYLSLAAAAAWQSLTRTPARGVPSSELWLFPDTILSKESSLLVAISKSGETSETLRACDLYREKTGSDNLVVTCNADSALTKLGSHVISTHNADEKSVAQTRSFTSMFLLIQAAAALASRRIDVFEELRAVPACFEGLTRDFQPLAKELGSSQDTNHFVFLGSGLNYGLACEAMLKMKEMSLSASEAFHTLEFRHGPKAVVNPNTLIVGLLSDSARAEEIQVLREMRDLGGNILAVTESGVGVPADHVVEIRSGLSEFSRSILLLPILQLTAYYRAISKGLNPDRPANLDAFVKL